jgi:hypothetical protein
MSIQKKNYRKKSLSKDDDLNYSEEEAEHLGIDLNDSLDDFDLDEEDDLHLRIQDEKESEEDDEIDEEDSEEIITKVVEAPIAEEPVKKRRGKKPADKEKFYVDPKHFDDEIVKYYKSGVMSNDLAEMVSKISHKLSYAPNFINYTYREEMVGDGIIRMFKALMTKKYDRDKGTNPFSYFTRIAFNAFRNRIKKEKHMRDTHEKYQNELMMMSENYNNLMRNNQLKMGKNKF